MIPTLHTPRLTLSPFTLADAHLVQSYAGDARVAATTAFVPHPYPDGAAEAWIATHLPQFLEKTNVTFAIRPYESATELLGAINLKLTLAPASATSYGEIGYWVAVPFWNKGICTEAAARIIHYGFNELVLPPATAPLSEIRAHHFVENSASGRVMQKAGMKRIGIIPRAVQKDGRLIDIVEYSIRKTR